jgi:hypothetical protein
MLKTLSRLAVQHCVTVQEVSYCFRADEGQYAYVQFSQTISVKEWGRFLQTSSGHETPGIPETK